MSQYIFDNAEPQAVSRFDNLARLHDAHTVSFLRATGIAEGWRCLEVGGGGGSIARWMTEQVGATGQVLVTDIDPRHLASLSSLGLLNLEVQRHDIGQDPLPEQHFDLIHVRLVLIHVPNRQEALTKLIAALKPGGWIVVEDYDPTLIEDRTFAMQDAANIALFEKMTASLRQLMTMRGQEMGWGRKLYVRLQDHGLVSVGMEGHLLVASGGSPGANLFRANFDQVRAEAVRNGLVTEAEMVAFLKLLEDPAFAFTLAVMMSAWGQRP